MPALAEHSKKHFKKLFGRSLQLRQISAAGCNACEADTNVLNTPFFDLARFGIQFVASPRHADGIADRETDRVLRREGLLPAQNQAVDDDERDEGAERLVEVEADGLRLIEDREALGHG